MKPTKLAGVLMCEADDHQRTVEVMTNLLRGGQEVRGFPYDDELVGPEGILATVFLPSSEIREVVFSELACMRDVASTRVVVVPLSWISEAYKDAFGDIPITLYYETRTLPRGHGPTEKREVRVEVHHGPVEVMIYSSTMAPYDKVEPHLRKVFKDTGKAIENLNFWWPDAPLIVLGASSKVVEILWDEIYGDEKA